MKDQNHALQDLNEIRSMMERSTKFVSLSGWAGVFAGFYALAGSVLATSWYGFHPETYALPSEQFLEVWWIGALVLVAALASAVFFSMRNARKKGNNIRNNVSRRMIAAMMIPLLSGGLLILLLIFHDLGGLAMPLTLLFYGLALYNAGFYTYSEVRIMGYVQILLGILAVPLIAYSTLIWQIGFGLVHILYGIYMFNKYER